MSSTGDGVLSAIAGWPGIEVDVHASRDAAAVRVYGHERAIARIDLSRGEVLVRAPRDTLATFHRAFPSARVTGNGLVFDLDRSPNAAFAVAAIRRRATVERLAWQFRVQSP
jgi:hypothetical protein